MKPSVEHADRLQQSTIRIAFDIHNLLDFLNSVKDILKMNLHANISYKYGN